MDGDRLSKSRKDGRRGGGHGANLRQGKEYWSARWTGASGARWGDGDAKRGTHQYERRQNKAACVDTEGTGGDGRA
jgi:hypothetical protein